MTEEQGSSEPDHAHVLVMPPLLYLGSIAVGVAAKWLFGGSIAPGSTARRVAATS